MDDLFLGEIRYVAFNFVPKGWAPCDGRLLPIAQNTALFSLLGTFYGGDGITTFALPDLRGRVAVGQGFGPGLSEYVLSERGGAEQVTLTAPQIPAHSHRLAAGSGFGTSNDPTAGVFAKPKVLRNGNLYAASGGTAAATDAIVATGSSSPHENRAPGLVLNAIIATVGIYPSRN